MLRVSPGCTLVLLASVALAPGFASRTHRAPTSGHAHASLAHRAKKAVSRRVKQVRGQREIDPQRATEIQNALIKAHYLDGTPSGQWDAQTEAAMQKYQADNGWQTRLTPDSRALIKLGLGPNTPGGATTAEASTAPQAAAAATARPNAAPDQGTLASVHAASQ